MTTLSALLAQLSPLLIYTAGAGAALVTADPWPAWFTGGAIVLGGGSNRLLKRAVAASSLGDTPAFQRPNPPAGGCGHYPGQYSQVTSGPDGFGFPSGHSQVASFAAMFWTLYVARDGPDGPPSPAWSKTLRIALLWLLAAGVFYSRLRLGCHNELQVAAGGLVGAVLGAVYFLILERNLD